MQYEKILHTFMQCKYMGTISKYTIKGEIGHNEQFLLFQSVFYQFGELYAIFIKSEIVIDSFSLEESNICRLGKG